MPFAGRQQYDIIFAHPGGCEIGPRPIDLHIKALRMMGANISDTQYGIITCEAGILKGCEIHLDYPSVGATENIMLCSVFAQGDTAIRNAAREPEIVDLQSYLVKAGARIHGAGSEEIHIQGLGPGAKLGSLEHQVMPDRIVAGTFLTAVAATGGRLCLERVVPEHMSSIFSVLKESGCELTVRKGSVDLKAPPRLRAVDMIRTLPYPGFPTDMQPQIMSLLTAARGTSIIVETVFESRYRHAEELQRMGADIRMQGPVAVIRGVERLTGAEVGVWDLRGGAAMIIAALRAEGVTSIFPAKHIDRGYEAIEERLVSLGARIVRVDPAGKNQPEPKEGNIWTKEPGEEFPETGSRPGAAKGSQQPG